MRFITDCALSEFKAWSGGKDTLDTIVKNGDVGSVEALIEDVFAGRVPSEGEINDFLWFDTDVIASHLGYYDWDGYERYHDWEEGDEVYWYDPAVNEYENPDEALKRVFTIDEIDRESEIASISDGYTEAEVNLSELELVHDK